MMSLFVVCILALFAAMSLAWVVQRAAGNAGWVDVFWTFGVGLTGAAAALYATPGSLPERRLLVAGIALIWALRLGLHVAFRVARSPEDTRYVELRQQWGGRFQNTMLGFLQLQALISIPLVGAIYLAAQNPAQQLRWLDAAGLALLVVAIIGEGVADAQLARFKRDPQHGPINDRGLWAWSRHPNYFFEWLGWWAYPVMAIGHPYGGWALLAPAIMYGVLVHLTGVPALERHMAQTRGALFDAYRRRTSAFIPMPPRTGDRP